MKLTCLTTKNLDLLTAEVHYLNVRGGDISGFVRDPAPAHVVTVVLLRDLTGGAIGEDECERH